MRRWKQRWNDGSTNQGTQTYHKPGEGHGTDPPLSPQKDPSLPTSSFQMSGAQRIHFYCYRPPNLWKFVIVEV